MPSSLPAVSLTLNIVSEESTFSEWVGRFIGGQGREVLLEWGEHGKGSIESSWVA